MFSKLCIRKPVTTIMVTLMVFIAGIVSYFNLDQALMPDMDLPIAVVMTTYVGASPEEIEAYFQANGGKPWLHRKCGYGYLLFLNQLVHGAAAVCGRYGHRHGCGGYAR